MWGNRFGWTISACIAVVFGFMLALAAMPAGIEAPTGKLSVGLQTVALPIDPLTIFKPGTSDQDAANLYREAMHDYDLNTQQYADWAQNATAALAADPLGVRKIVEARDCSKINLFAKDPTELINYENNTPSIDAIYAVAHATDNIANLSAAKGDLPKARKYGEALFALGYNLARERVRWIEWDRGVTIMEWAAKDLEKAEPDRAKAFADFGDAAQAYQSKIGGIGNTLSAIDPKGYAGDIFQMAQPTNPEVMWRVEAIMRLGRLTYFAPTRGDQLVTRHFLTKLADDPTEDRLVHAAAVAACTLMEHPEQYHRIGLSTQ